VFPGKGGWGAGDQFAQQFITVSLSTWEYAMYICIWKNSTVNNSKQNFSSRV
jgi:hypothetical protein